MAFVHLRYGSVKIRKGDNYAGETADWFPFQAD